ncbi:MAG TPA: hypothetical protein VKZ93_02145 [Arenibacter sp.]|nr:hypothetical protein [Arenibacter sp.]
MGFLTMANMNPPSHDNTSYVIGEADFLGNWVYTVEDVSPEYSSGILHITKRNGELAVEVALKTGRLRGEQVKIVDNAMNFTVNIEGQVVAVKLTVAGNKISGTSSSSEGTFKLTGTKRAES